nr:hypothetical protein CFP56_12459 [Quercus suber]
MKHGELTFAYRDVTLNMGIYVAPWKLSMFLWQTHQPEDDKRHWDKFPSFSPFKSQVEFDGGKNLDLSNYPYIFMRWKEQYFVNVGTDLMAPSVASIMILIAAHFRSLS